jgi:hypothetical protein
MADVPAEGAVPPVVVPAVVAHPDIHAVLAICGFANVMDRTSIINNEGFQLLADFGILEDKDVFKMVKRLGNRTVAAGRVNVGAIQVKKLHALCYWVRDQQKQGQSITQDDWDDDTVMATIEKIRIEKGQDTGNVLVMDLGKFNPDDFKTHETVCVMSLFLLNLLMMPNGTCISYPLQVRLTAWTTVYRLLKRFLIITSGWTWIEPYDTM